MVIAVSSKSKAEDIIPKPGSISFEDRVTKKVPFEWGYRSTPRVNMLREIVFWKAAVLNSVGKIPYMHSQLLNQKFLPQFLEGDNRKLFADYLKVWHEKGTIPHIQFNVVDSHDLRDAQEHPEKHTNLQVRVAGYSAFWIDLSVETQDSIIDRAEQSLSC